MQYTPIVSFNGAKFPFGVVYNETFRKYRRIFVKNKIQFNSQHQYQALQQKISIFKNISHKNFINLKFIEEVQRGYIDIFYGYVHHKFEEFSSENQLNIKNIHEQLIKMIVYAAKHSIIIPFDSCRCGLKIVNGQKIVKYYFPINQLLISNDRVIIERHVQLFTVQSMQYLYELVFGKARPLIPKSVQSKQYSLSNKKNKQYLETNKAHKNVFSQKIINFNMIKQRESHRNQQNSYKTIKSTNTTIQKSKSKSKSQSESYQSSLQKYLVRKDDLNKKITQLKQRSLKALIKLKEIKIDLKSSSKEKDRKYTLDFNLNKRLTINSINQSKNNSFFRKL